jgi:hypothetical protein
MSLSITERLAAGPMFRADISAKDAAFLHTWAT